MSPRRTLRRMIAGGCALLIAAPLGIGIASADNEPQPTDWPEVEKRSDSGGAAEPEPVDWPAPESI